MTDDESKFRGEIETFLSDTGMAASRLGREALNDSAFVTAVLAGKRSPGLKTTGKLRAFMSAYRKRAKAARRQSRTKEIAIA